MEWTQRGKFDISTPTIPIVALTAVEVEEMRYKIYDSGNE